MRANRIERSAGCLIKVSSAWCLWQWLPLVLAYELVSLALVVISPNGRRLEDLPAGTRVVTEGSYRRRQKRQQATLEQS